MLNLTAMGFLVQNVTKPTFGSNFLDLVFTEETNRIFQIKIGPLFCSSAKQTPLYPTIGLLPNAKKNQFLTVKSYFIRRVIILDSSDRLAT